MASFLGLSEAQKSLVAKAHQARQLKLESSVAAETGRWSPVDSSDRYESPGASLEADDERRILLNRMERLDNRERTILALRYGLEGESPLTLKEIGRRLGVTREWVRKIELRALRKLDPEHEDDLGTGSDGLSPARSTRRSRSAGPSRAVAPGFSSAPVEPRARARLSVSFFPRDSAAGPAGRGRRSGVLKRDGLPGRFGPLRTPPPGVIQSVFDHGLPGGRVFSRGPSNRSLP